MRFLVYTCVFGGYDRVYPPIRPEPGLDHVIVTDDAGLRVPGWRTQVVDMAPFATPKAANLYHRALIHRVLRGYDAALYIDGNMRLLGPTSRVFGPFLVSGAALAAWRHPQRSTVAAEAEACITGAKVPDPARIWAELAEYGAAGFPDDQGLFETGILLKNHRVAALDPAMALWWELYARHLTRDQISLPFVLWKTGLSRHVLPGSFRDPNPYFALYPHARAKGVNPLYAHVSARSHDSLLHRALLGGWHATWALRRRLRRRRA
jgi:hypothetical protein